MSSSPVQGAVPSPAALQQLNANLQAKGINPDDLKGKPPQEIAKTLQEKGVQLPPPSGAGGSLQAIG